MEILLPLLLLIIGLVIGGGAGWLWAGRQLGAENARLAAEKQAAEDRIRQHQQDMAAMEERAALQFENLANRIFEQKSDSFKKQSHENLNQLLTPLREHLQQFQQKVEAAEKEQFSLKNEIRNIVAANEKITLQAESLTRALKGDVKAQGNWGEVMLEKILEDSGLRAGDDYILQGADMALKTGDGRAQKPDVIVKLPEDKHIIIDAKVSLTAYERYCAAGDDAARAAALKEFIASTRAHVTGLEARRYQDADKLGTPDFVLMFMPVEGAYSLAVQEDRALHGFAWDKKIVIVCPSTLFATLRTIASVWRIELQNSNALEIARQAGALYDKIASFVEDMQDIGKRLGQTQQTFDAALAKLSTGNGNILRRVENLRALGAKTSKKLPALRDDIDDTVQDLRKTGEQ